MSKEFVPSEEAQREGVCHTESECKAELLKKGVSPGGNYVDL